MKKTIVVNLFAGPGCGKSTNAYLLAGLLKAKGVSTELVSEFAKDATWEERKAVLEYQPYVTAKQMWKQHRVHGKVSVIVTDSPIPIGLLYQGQHCPPSFNDFVIDVFNTYDNVNFFLRRNPDNHPYDEVGRSQTEEQSIGLDGKAKWLLTEYNIPFEEIDVLPDIGTALLLQGIILQKLS